MRYKKYDRKDDHAYTFGVFPTLELLTHQPAQTLHVLIHSSGDRSEGVKAIRTRCQQLGIPVEVNDAQIERIAAKENTYAIGVFHKYRPTLEAGANHVVLVNPSDMGNLGTTLRTLLGFGFHDLALIEPAADIFDPRATRASMGALFQMRFAYYKTFEDYAAAYPRMLYPFMTDGDVALPDAQFQPPFGLIFGSESAGLPASYRSIGTSVTIPQRNTIDSLNLAIAIGIAVYEVTRKRSTE
jgi:RNA methyltransferase, TrmH family